MKVCKGVVASPSLRGLTFEKAKRIIDESGADVIIHTAAISGLFGPNYNMVMQKDEAFSNDSGQYLSKPP